jgi:flagellar hook assembly protein FlgD
VRKGPEAALATEFRLNQNYPNPFNPSTTIAYEIPSESDVALRVFNVLGEEVASLVHQRQERGVHSVQWDGVTATGTRCSSGVYFLHMVAGSFVDVKRMILLK